MRATVTPLVLADQVAPPSAEPIIVPVAPMARQALDEVQATPLSAFAPVPVPVLHVVPSVV